MQIRKSSKQIMKELILFSMPLILSGMLQQLFSWVDALIIGNIVGENALAGIGATTSLYNLFVMAIIGFTSGLSVLFAYQYGEGKYTNNTILLANFVVCLTLIFTAIAIVGSVLVTPILKAIHTPTALFPYAKQYLTIMLMGLPFLTVYNIYSAALRGMGNSRVPFCAVLTCSITNAILDMLFVAVFQLGVKGAAFATWISQIVMAIYIVVYTIIKYPELRFSLLQANNRVMLRKGANYGTPLAIQNSVSSVGNVYLQRFMNGFGEQTVAAITTAYRIDTVLLLPIINLSTAISTMVSMQNGAGNKKEAKRIFKYGTVLMIVMSLFLSIVIFKFGKMLLTMFGLGIESIAIGEEFFKIIAVFYVVNGIGMAFKGYLEGISDIVFSGSVGICSLLVRIICSHLFVFEWNNMVVAYAEVFSWIFLLLVLILRYAIITSRKDFEISSIGI